MLIHFVVLLFSQQKANFPACWATYVGVSGSEIRPHNSLIDFPCCTSVQLFIPGTHVANLVFAQQTNIVTAFPM